MKKISSVYYWLMGVLGLVLMGLPAQAATDVDTIVTNAETVWGTVKTLILAIVGFTILIKVVKAFRK